MTGEAITLAAEMRDGRRDPEGVVENALAAIERDRLNAFVAATPDRARTQGRRVAAALKRGEDPGPLAGVPVAVKDNICVRGTPTTCASRMLGDFQPLYDATVVERLEAAGAVVVGKTNLDEFAMGSSTENSAWGPSSNPWDPDRVPGGSSGGSAVAVSAGTVPLALGSDTGGSIRQPASLTGIYGLKPTYGRVSRYGLVAFASSLDQIGAFARDPESLEAIYRVIAGHDPRDSTSVPRPVDGEPEESIANLRVGIDRDLLDRDGVEPAVAEQTRAAAAALEAAGADPVAVTLPDPDTAVRAYYLVAPAEASSNLARFDGVRYGLRVRERSLAETYRRTRSRGFGPEVQRRILIGTYALSAGYYDAYYGRALKARNALRRAFADLFTRCDVILLPTSPTTAFAKGERTRDPLSMYLADVFTVYANLTGIPGISIPHGFDGNGLPVGVQVLAPSWREDLLFLVSRALDRVRPDRDRRPTGEGGSS